MKRTIAILLSGILAFSCALMTSAESLPQSSYKSISISQIGTREETTDSVVPISDYDLSDIKDFEPLRSFMERGGIVLTIGTNNCQDMSRISDQLGMALQPSQCINGNSVGIVDLATLYYNYGNGKSGIYIISALPNITEAELAATVDEAIDTIHQIQLLPPSDVLDAARASSGSSIGIINVTTTYQPRGKLRASFEFFTVQDYNTQDYYIVKAKVNGQPGCVLASSDSNYESKYQGKEMKVTIGTNSDSVSTDSYGPYSTNNATSYSVSVGGSFQDGLPGFAANFSYSRSIYNTNIAAALLSGQASWTLDLKSKAQEQTCDFEPAVTFRCPSTKASADFTLFASYDLDAWNTLTKTISLSRTVRCTPSGVSQL